MVNMNELYGDLNYSFTMGSKDTKLTLTNIVNNVPVEYSVTVDNSTYINFKNNVGVMVKLFMKKL